MVKGNNSTPDVKITSVGVRVPSFLTVTNSPLTSSGNIDINYNHTPLPISSGGTGLTSVGSKGQILSVISSDPEQLGWVEGSGTGTVTSISMSLPDFLTVSQKTITSSGSFDISLSSTPLPVSSGGTGLTTLGQPNQVLSINSSGTELEYTTLPKYLKSVSLTTSTPFLSIDTSATENSTSLQLYSSTIPIEYGGTGLTILGQPNQVLVVNSSGTELEYKTLEKGIESISISTPEFLTVSSPNSNSFDISLSSTPLPISSGGTGLTILGQPSQVLTVNSTGEKLEFTSPAKGSVTSISLSTSTPFLQVSTDPITDSGFLSINASIIPIKYGGTGLTEPGQPNQILTSNGSSLLWANPPDLNQYLTTIETLSPLSYSENTLSISSYTGSGRVVFENSPVLTTPILGDAFCSSLSLNGSNSGSVKLSSQSGNYNFIFPNSIGKPFQILTSQGPFLPTTWSSTIGSGDLLKVATTGSKGQILSITSSDPVEFGWIDGAGTGTVTSVSISLPDFLTVSQPTITSSGSFDISLSSTPLPVSSGGTGLTILGQPNQVLSVNSLGTELEYKTLPKYLKSVSLATSVPFLSIDTSSTENSTSLQLHSSTIPIEYGGTGLTTLGQPNQVLSINSSGTGLEYTTIEKGVESVSITLPDFLTVSQSTITSSGSFDISLSSTPLPISSGGTGLTTLGQPFQVVTVNSTGEKLEFTSPAKGSVTSISLSTSTPFLQVSTNPVTDSGFLSINASTIPINYGGTGLTNPGRPNQILTSNGSSLLWTDPPDLSQYLTTVNVLPPLTYSDNTISISSFTGSGKIVFDNSATLTTPSLFDPTTNALKISGSQSGIVTISAVSGNYNFILPTNYGKPFQVLTSQGPFNPTQWVSTTGSGDIVCSQNSILSGQTVFTNGTILCKSKIIQSQGFVTITQNTTLNVQEMFAVLIIDSSDPISITLPDVKEIHDFIGDFTMGNRISTIIQNKSSALTIQTSNGITLIDGRSSPSILVQEYTYIMTNAEEGLLLIK